jgi:hypothetical protein
VSFPTIAPIDSPNCGSRPWITIAAGRVVWFKEGRARESNPRKVFSSANPPIDSVVYEKSEGKKKPSGIYPEGFVQILTGR